MSKCGITNVGTPYKVYSNGGCLFDSVSVLLCGTQGLSKELRVRTYIEMVRLKDRIASLSITPEFLTVSPNYINSVFACASSGGFSSIWTIFALSNATGLPMY